jgi:hypothetical protein
VEENPKVHMSKEKELKIEDFWWYHNDTCWRIQRECKSDVYWFALTDRYIFKNCYGEWRGMKKYINNDKLKHLKTEHDAVKWLAKL